MRPAGADRMGAAAEYAWCGAACWMAWPLWPEAGFAVGILVLAVGPLV